MAEVTLGGDRIGSGEKMKQELHNYGMNSFNVSRDWKSTMAPGILYPCFKEIGTPHGTFDIDIDHFVRTLPTKGPLLGSFKMQVDLYNVPFRLYNGILHNNPVDIGLNMNQVYLPVIKYHTTEGKGAPRVVGSNDYSRQVNESALIKYMGISGYGTFAGGSTGNSQISRKLQCVPILGYYDIFKNYYSNKQEENAYVIGPGSPTEINTIWYLEQGNRTEDESQIIVRYPNGTYNQENFAVKKDNGNTWIFQIVMKKKNELNSPEEYLQYITVDAASNDNTLEYLINNNILVLLGSTINPYNGDCTITFMIPGSGWQTFIDWAKDEEGSTETETNIAFVADYQTSIYTSDIELKPFALKNIDKMRSKLLSCNELGDKFIIDAEEQDDTGIWGYDSGVDQTGLPYSTLSAVDENGLSLNAYADNGLVVKTYQSDLFNNWLDSSFTDTIAQRTKIDTTSGGFTPDTLILQEKIYTLLNRIIVGGGSYYDWQEATYGEGIARMCEIPMYIGGMSAEIMFEEVISQAETSLGGDYMPLGSLGGKGTAVNKKGGTNIHVRMDEPGYIIGICSITPRISVSQGNDWDITELQTLDDLHKPELDGIGFQDLIAEQMCWWDTLLAAGVVVKRNAVGKQTAWINYQTAVDKVYGDFAKQDGYAFMVLNRNYEIDNYNGIKDMTTYIDPAKYNYAFAATDLASQNFWVQLSFKVTARRKMGAQQLPML